MICCLCHIVANPFKASFVAPETPEMRKLPDYEEKVGKFLPEIR